MRGRLPTEHELANIVYRCTHGLRGRPHTEESSEPIRESRWAAAIVVCNRAKQNISWGRGAGTEPEDPILDSSLARRGNGRAYQECYNMAVAALRVHAANLPLDAAMYLRGAQYYRHNDHRSYHRWPEVNGNLVRAIGPMGDVAGNQFWFGIYLDPDWLAREMGRQASGAGGRP